MSTYLVKAPYVTLAVKDSTGSEVVLGFYEGGVVTDPVPGDRLDKHVRTGMVEKASESDAYGAGVDPDAEVPKKASASKSNR